MSAIPGPESLAMIVMPLAPLDPLTGCSVTLPRLAYETMLRASSEMAVAMSVASLIEKPVCSATARPCWRAVTMSLSDAIRICESVANASAPSVDAPGLLLQILQAFLQIERGGDVLERQSELHHREGDLRLDADDDGRGAAQADHVRDLKQGARGKRIHDVHRGNVHDDPGGSVAHHLLHQRRAQIQKVRIRQCGLDGRDEHAPLLENGYLHAAVTSLAGI